MKKNIIGLGILVCLAVSMGIQTVLCYDRYVIYPKFPGGFNLHQIYAFNHIHPCTAYMTTDSELFRELFDRTISNESFISQGGSAYPFSDPESEHTIDCNPETPVSFMLISDDITGEIIDSAINIYPQTSYNLESYFYYDLPNQFVTIGDSIQLDFGTNGPMGFWSIIGGEDRADSYYFYGVVLLSLEDSLLLFAPVYPISYRELYNKMNEETDIRMEIPTTGMASLKGSRDFFVALVFGSPDYADCFTFEDDTPINIRFALQGNPFGTIIAAIGCIGILGCSLYIRRKLRISERKAHGNLAHYYIQLSKKKQELKKVKIKQEKDSI